jgi:hypothetical protein
MHGREKSDRQHAVNRGEHRSDPISLNRVFELALREVFKAALILQRRMRTRRSFSRSARLYRVEPAPHSSSSCPSTTCCRLCEYDS